MLDVSRRPGNGRERASIVPTAASWLVPYVTSPERRLLAAVLESAVKDLSHPGADFREKARAWFAEHGRFAPVPSATGWPCSFSAICAEFGIHPDWVRRRLACELGTQPGPPAPRHRPAPGPPEGPWAA